jgi:transcriptional regulator
MYTPKCFDDSTIEEVREFITKNSFGILINTLEGKLWATHIPMEFAVNAEGNEVLTGHIAKGNVQWKGFKPHQEALAIFQGPHSYVSPTWYNHKNVPTWNYVAVHVYGSITLIEGEQLYKALKQLMDKYETLKKTHLKIEDLPEKLIKKEMRGIIGFEIAVKEVKAAFKLSQNRDDESYKNIIKNLETSEHQHEAEIANYMKGRRKNKFSN